MAERRFRVTPTINGTPVEPAAFNYSVHQGDFDGHGGSERDALSDFLHQDHSNIFGFKWEEING